MQVSTWGLVLGVSVLALGCGPDDSSFEPQRIARLGSVSVGSSFNAAWTPKPFGIFYRLADQAAQADCEVILDNGTCRVWSCTDAAYSQGSSLKTVGAGSVHVTSSSQSLELTRAEDGFYRQPEAPSELWKEGDRLSLSIQGSADFPGMTAKLLAPGPLTVTAPVLTDPPLLIDKSVDLPLVWSGPQTGNVVVTISAETVASEGADPILSPGIDCEFSAAAGSAFTPAAFLKMLPTPATLTQYYMDVLTYSYTHAATRDAWVDFQANWVGFSTPATVQ